MNRNRNNRTNKSEANSLDDDADIVLLANLKRGKAMHERVSFLENHLGKLCNIFSDYSLQSAEVRDKNDELAQIIAKFASDEHFNTTAKLSLKVVAELIASVGDHRNAEVKRIEAKVVPSLASYGNICKYLRNDIKTTVASLQKESSSKRSLEKIVNKVGESGKGQFLIELAEGEYEKACAQSTRLQNLTCEQMSKFEQNRLKDLKESLQTFFKIEIAMHAKSLELLTNAYKYVESIDEEADLKVMKTELGFDTKKAELESESAKRKLKCGGRSRNYGNTSQNEDDELTGDWKNDFQQKLEQVMAITPRKSVSEKPIKKKIQDYNDSSRGGSDGKSDGESVAGFSNKKGQKKADKVEVKIADKKTVKAGVVRVSDKKDKETTPKKVSFELKDKDGRHTNPGNNTKSESESTFPCCTDTEISVITPVVPQRKYFSATLDRPKSPKTAIPVALVQNRSHQLRKVQTPREIKHRR